MNNLKRAVIGTILLVTVTCILPTDLQAQGPGFPPDPVDTPFDGGVTLIAAAAVGYGIKKLRDKKKDK